MPLFKSGNSGDPSNYRPICILPILSKIVERHIHDSLYTFLSKLNLIFPRQSGFRKRPSTEAALIRIIDELLFNLDNNRINGMVLVDYCKAFDMVDHKLLLQKLKIYGIVGLEHKWCESYLSDRTQLVSLNGEESSTATMHHSVPQGSILGPLFFILFINDLPLHVTSDIDLYADDTTVTASADYKEIGKLNAELSKSVNEIQLWANTNRLPLNKDKTKVIMISGRRLASKVVDELAVIIDGDKFLENTNKATLLGLDIDSKLCFSEHIDKICKKLAKRVGILRKIRSYLPLKQ